ncbi:MAG: response regulator transcription factor [Armatimonadetes bacterium]|nr:response regulator transcription factor [Armatimonadota bacterium]
MPTTILLVDDDHFLLENAEALLKRSGEYVVRTCFSGEEALNLLADEPVDLVVLDLGLPGIDGITTCRRIRAKWTMPIIMLTARTDSMDKVIGLEVGADDYLTKPFEPSELTARIRAQLRRATEYLEKQPAQKAETTVGNWVIDHAQRQVFIDGQSGGLTNREFEIIAYLCKNRNRAISRESLFEGVWGYDMEFSSNSLDVLIYRIRKKLEKDPNNPDHLQTVRGFGYKLA